RNSKVVNMSCEMMMTVALLLLLLASSLADASLIFDAAEVKVTPGESLTLSCGVKQQFRLCLWSHEDGRSFLVEDVHAGAHPGMSAPRNLTDNQCGINIESVSTEDSGAWTCSVFLADRGTEFHMTKTVTACHTPFTAVGGGCFYFHEFSKNWHNARDYCRGMSTSEYTVDLATVDSCDQLGIIRQFILMTYEPVWHWIGGSDMNEESNWHWVNGDTVPSSVPFWYPGHPLIDTTANCLCLEEDYGYYYDYDCENIGPFLCEEVPITTSYK
ncbi:hypothetical protein OTU49_015723, partial [Cherax quadricarinatus]